MLGWMIKHNLPLTREGYIRANWGPDGPTEQWNAEHEADIPPFLRDPSYAAVETDTDD
jgi:hypothetical protein